MNQIEQYIRQAAAARGIDPDVAVRAARTEGGLSDPFQQSNVVTRGAREPSYGPFQLLIGGGGTGFPSGLGNAALAAGVDPRKNWQGGVDFALDTVAQEGWKQWYGPKNAGIGRWTGVNSGAKPMGVTLNSGPTDIGTITKPAGIEAGPAGQFPEAPAAPTPLQMMAAGDTKGGLLKGLEMLGGKGGPEGAASPLDVLSKLGGGQEEAPPPQLMPSNALASAEAADASRFASAQTLMAQLLQNKRNRAIPGMSLMG